MSKQNGQLTICDRCGEEIFRKCTGEEERDGGFTRWNTFEPKPRGWSNHKGFDLCPGCATAWNKLETEFLNRETQFFKKEG